MLSVVEIGTIVTAVGGIGLTVRGSKRYEHSADLTGEVQDENNEVASRDIAAGGGLMLSLAALGGDPRYWVPQIFLAGNSLKSYLRNKFEAVDNIIEAVPKQVLDVVVVSIAVSIMVGLVLTGEIDSVRTALAPLGLSALGIAYGLDQKTKMDELIYRILTVSGGGLLTAGAGLDLTHAEELRAQVMSGSFLGLNAYFLASEGVSLAKNLQRKDNPESDEQ